MNHTAQRFASDVHTLPEARSGEKDGMWRRTKFPKQRRAWSGTLYKQGIVHVRFYDRFHLTQAWRSW